MGYPATETTMILLIPMALAAPEDSYLNWNDRVRAIQPKKLVLWRQNETAENGTTFDYAEEGGENNLFVTPVGRYLK